MKAIFSQKPTPSRKAGVVAIFTEGAKAKHEADCAVRSTRMTKATCR